ncbi:YkvA family protein [Terrisporobacter mayombei]|uniref:DUF1232 domain-containing protein n=1 Tax=Terrisporobacter mayombei TaxID=1541 RepID=A0ABY9PYT2_9FIRM|nr:DUF1232 domain-containing protein [Terrisporobacter mayombei]MCC3868082.1 DUF1232 domain-containing protein [Terrisporobacter mayombei]WMT80220.1 hypothetical protein TEMA_05330 [Terrisporobacter mayombei]
MTNLQSKANRLKLDLPAIFIALKKRETPIMAKLFAGITIVYALSPIDLIPDFIPFLGLLDDIILLPILIGLTIKFIPSEILEQCKIESRDLWKSGKPKKWYLSIPIIFMWIIILLMIIKYILN